mmetsp:Transcript_39082/g.124425  ORF Transcript_39082/g.124425 Transcript_39082/m.124425 type:complete len:214 (-) Transcript_39082:2737-3378(-)
MRSAPWWCATAATAHPRTRTPASRSSRRTSPTTAARAATPLSSPGAPSPACLSRSWAQCPSAPPLSASSSSRSRWTSSVAPRSCAPWGPSAGTRRPSGSCSMPALTSRASTSRTARTRHTGRCSSGTARCARPRAKRSWRSMASRPRPCGARCSIPRAPRSAPPCSRITKPSPSRPGRTSSWRPWATSTPSSRASRPRRRPASGCHTPSCARA